MQTHDPSADVRTSREIARLTSALSLEEKAALTVGIDTWRTASFLDLAYRRQDDRRSERCTWRHPRPFERHAFCLHTLGNRARRHLGHDCRRTGECSRGSPSH